MQLNQRSYRKASVMFELFRNFKAMIPVVTSFWHVTSPHTYDNTPNYLSLFRDIPADTLLFLAAVHVQQTKYRIFLLTQHRRLLHRTARANKRSAQLSVYTFSRFWCLYDSLRTSNSAPLSWSKKCNDVTSSLYVGVCLGRPRVYSGSSGYKYAWSDIFCACSFRDRCSQ